jgi:hypothetical protein
MSKNIRLHRIFGTAEVSIASSCIGAMLGGLAGLLYDLKYPVSTGGIAGAFLGFAIAIIYMSIMIRALKTCFSDSSFCNKAMGFGALAGLICSSLVHLILAGVMVWDHKNFQAGSSSLIGIVIIVIVFGTVPGFMLGWIAGRKLWRDCRPAIIEENTINDSKNDHQNPEPESQKELRK